MFNNSLIDPQSETYFKNTRLSLQLDSFAAYVDPKSACDTPVRFGTFTDDPSAHPKGLVAIIDRGDCKFVTKVKNAQSQGFVGEFTEPPQVGSPVRHGPFLMFDCQQND